jgi:hypothetical protein
VKNFISFLIILCILLFIDDSTLFILHLLQAVTYF